MEEGEAAAALFYLEGATTRVAAAGGGGGAAVVQLTRRLNRKFDAARRAAGADSTMSGTVQVKRGRRRIARCATGLERCPACSGVFIAGINMRVRAKRGGRVAWQCLSCGCSVAAVAESSAPRDTRGEQADGKLQGAPATAQAPAPAPATAGAAAVALPRKKPAKGLKALLRAKREKEAQDRNPALGYFLGQ